MANNKDRPTTGLTAKGKRLGRPPNRLPFSTLEDPGRAARQREEEVKRRRAEAARDRRAKLAKAKWVQLHPDVDPASYVKQRRSGTLALIEAVDSFGRNGFARQHGEDRTTNDGKARQLVGVKRSLTRARSTIKRSNNLESGIDWMPGWPKVKR